jgi:hypothetical protein
MERCSSDTRDVSGSRSVQAAAAAALVTLDVTALRFRCDGLNYFIYGVSHFVFRYIMEDIIQQVNTAKLSL